MLKRHLISGSKTDISMSYDLFGSTNSKNNQQRRDTNLLFVEVCTGGCQQNGCLNSESSVRSSCWFNNIFLYLLIFFLYIY